MLAIAWLGLAWPVSAQTLPSLLQQHTVPMWLIDPVDGTIVDANAAAAEFYGYPALRSPGGMNIRQINQLPEADVRAEVERARREGLDYYLFPHRLASGRIVTVEVHSAPMTIDGRTLLLSVLLPESRSVTLQQELQRYQNRLEGQVAERTEEAVRAQTERARTLAWALAGAVAAIVALAVALVLLRRSARRVRDLADELEDTLQGARLGRLRWDLVHGTITPCPRLRRLIGLDEHGQGSTRPRPGCSGCTPKTPHRPKAPCRPT